MTFSCVWYWTQKVIIHYHYNQSIIHEKLISPEKTCSLAYCESVETQICAYCQRGRLFYLCCDSCGGLLLHVLFVCYWSGEIACLSFFFYIITCIFNNSMAFKAINLHHTTPDTTLGEREWEKERESATSVYLVPGHTQSVLTPVGACLCVCVGMWLTPVAEDSLSFYPPLASKRGLLHSLRSN